MPLSRSTGMPSLYTHCPPTSLPVVWFWCYCFPYGSFKVHTWTKLLGYWLQWKRQCLKIWDPCRDLGICTCPFSGSAHAPLPFWHFWTSGFQAVLWATLQYFSGLKVMAVSTTYWILLCFYTFSCDKCLLNVLHATLSLSQAFPYLIFALVLRQVLTILKVKDLRLRNIKWFSQRHTTSNC